MFKINHVNVQTMTPTLGSKAPPSPGNFSFSTVAARSPTRMSMNIANLKNTRGCSACGK